MSYKNKHCIDVNQAKYSRSIIANKSFQKGEKQ